MAAMFEPLPETSTPTLSNGQHRFNHAIYIKSGAPAAVGRCAVAMTGNGISCTSAGRRIDMDPRAAGPGAVNFVSHAHADHLPRRNGGVILASRETGAIAEKRGLRMDHLVEAEAGLELVYAGHVLGSRGLLVDGGELFYTGDICTRRRGFLAGARVPRCRTLVMECTFGLPQFSFPPVGDVRSRTDAIISDLYARGRPVVLMGYQLGKAQTLSEMFGHWKPLYYHDSVKEMNDLHRSLGVALPDAPGHTEAEKAGLLARGPWIMVAPMMPSSSPFVADMKARYGAVTVGFTGWAGSGFPHGRKCDRAVPLSDHCDFAELVQLAEATGAETVLTVHGFVDEFAGHLRRLGFDARPLRGAAGGAAARSLDDFAAAPPAGRRPRRPRAGCL